jgi:glucose/mannose-6-phosphate isomerase
MEQTQARTRLHNFLEDIRYSIDTEIDLGERKVNGIFMGAMGGSAIASNIVANCCAHYLDMPLTTNRSPIIPKWVGKDTLSIIATYSGNTDETLEMYNKVKATGAVMVVITSGGKIKGIAEKDGIPVLTVPTGFQPRYSAGFMIGYIAAIMSSIGLPEFKNRLKGCLASLENYRNYLESPGSLAYLLADKYKGSVPVICTESKYKCVSLRWKAAFNENAKTICFDTALSEFRYCEQNPWAEYKGKNLRLIVLTGENDLAAGGPVNNAVKNIESLEFPFDLVAVAGSSHEERVFRALILGDYVTVYMAEAAGIDPETTPVITELKKRIRGEK